LARDVDRRDRNFEAVGNQTGQTFEVDIGPLHRLAHRLRQSIHDLTSSPG
jgi:hypothetical protein